MIKARINNIMVMCMRKVDDTVLSHEAAPKIGELVPF